MIPVAIWDPQNQSTYLPEELDGTTGAANVISDYNIFKRPISPAGGWSGRIPLGWIPPAGREELHPARMRVGEWESGVTQLGSRRRLALLGIYTSMELRLHAPLGVPVGR